MDSEAVYCIYSLIGVYRRLFELGAYYWYGRLPPGALSGQALLRAITVYMYIDLTTEKRLIIGDDLFGEIGEFKKFAKISCPQIITLQSLYI